jgi:hypothetical protein
MLRKYNKHSLFRLIFKKIKPNLSSEILMEGKVLSRKIFKEIEWK